MKHLLTNKDIKIDKSKIKGAGKGAFSKIDIPKGVTIGSYKGKRLTAKQYDKIKPNGDDDYIWEVSSPKGPFYIDGRLKKYSNWTRYINDHKGKRQNLEPYQHNGKIYFRTIKTIKAGDELYYTYGDEYW